MKKSLICTLFLLVIVIFITTSNVSAFNAVTFDNGMELTTYGFLRNNLGMFTQTQDYAANGNQFATARTWLRLYGDYKIAEPLRLWVALQAVWEPWYKVERGSNSEKSSKEYSEYDHINDVLREAYIEWHPNRSNSFKFGRQIAIWGEALTTRVGDVIHPDDSRFSFAFANLEDTRIPQYMLRCIHDFSSTNTSFEWIINPLLVGEEYRVNRTGEYYNQNGDGANEQRFGTAPEDRYKPPYYVNAPPFPYGAPGWSPSQIVGWPVASSFTEIAPGLWAPVTEIPSIIQEYPDNSLDDMRFGFRTNTLLKGFVFGVSYWHTQTYNPRVARRHLNAIFREYKIYYPDIDIIGIYMNKQLPWPGVVRAEATWIPNQPFSTTDIVSEPSCLARRDDINYMLAYDLSGFIYPDWHKTAPIDITFEHTGQWVPDSDEILTGYWNTDQPTYHAGFNLRVSTNWRYNKIATDVIFGYDTFGNSGLLMPTVKYTPAFLNEQLSFELKYIGIYGDSNYEGLGIFRGKDMVVLTTQFFF